VTIKHLLSHVSVDVVTGAQSARTYVGVEHCTLVMTTEYAPQLQESAFVMITGVEHVIVVYAQGIGKESIVHWLWLDISHQSICIYLLLLTSQLTMSHLMVWLSMLLWLEIIIYSEHVCIYLTTSQFKSVMHLAYHKVYVS
jgi:hypothetical protein